MIRKLDQLIDRTTMYRLVFWYLAMLIGVSVVLGGLHVIAIDPVALLLSTALVIASGYLANTLMAWAFRAIPNRRASTSPA